VSGPVFWARRVLRMSPPEILHRARRTVADELDRWRGPDRAEGSLTSSRDVAGPGIAMGEDWPEAGLLGPIGSRGVGRDLVHEFPDQASRLSRSADTILEGRIPLFGGTTWVEFESCPDYHRDPCTLERWPVVHHSRVRVRRPGPRGDIRILWELGRLHHVPTLGGAGRVTGDPRYGRAALHHIFAFLDQVPHRHGAVWASPLESAVRLLSISLGLASLRGEIVLDADSRQRLSRAIRAHLDHVASRMALYSSTNNHTLGEASALVVAGLLFPGLRSAGDHVRRGADVLARELERQVFADGVPREQSPSYGLFILQLVTLAQLVAGRKGLELDPVVRARATSLLGWLDALRGNGSRLPSLGDGDDGVAFDLTGDRELLSSLRCSARCCGAAPKAELARLDLLSALLAGDLPEPTISAPRPEGVVTFEEGGGVLLGRRGGPGAPDEVQCVVRCGPFGLAPLFGHAHADQLSVVLSISGRPVIVDPGTYLYHGAGAWRDLLRSTRSHNTLCVDQADQAVIRGPFLWSNPARGTIEKVESGAGQGVRLTHDGYRRLDDPVVHEREVTLVGDVLRIVDRIRCERPHEVELGFQLAPDLLARREGSRVEVRTPEGQRLLVARLDSMLRPFLVRGGESPPSGQVSPRFGVLVPAFRLGAAGTLEPGRPVVTEVSIDRGGLP